MDWNSYICSIFQGRFGGVHVLPCVNGDAPNLGCMCPGISIFSRHLSRNGVTRYTVCSGFMILSNLHAVLCGCYDKFPISRRKVRPRFLTSFPLISLSPFVIMCSCFHCTVFRVFFRLRCFKCLWEEVSAFMLVMKFVDPRDTAISEPWIIFILDCGPTLPLFLSVSCSPPFCCQDIMQ